MQIKTKRYNYADPEWLKFKRLTIPSISRNVEQLEGISHTGKAGISTKDEHTHILRSCNSIRGIKSAKMCVHGYQNRYARTVHHSFIL